MTWAELGKAKWLDCDCLISDFKIVFKTHINCRIVITL